MFYTIWLVSGILSTNYVSMLESGIALLSNTILLFLFCFKWFNHKIAVKPQFFYINTVLFSICCFALGCFAKHIQEYKRDRNNIVNVRGEDEGLYEISIDERLKGNTTYNRYIASVSRVDNSEIQGKVLVQVIASSDSLHLGNIVLIKGQLRSFSSSKNVGQFDYQKYMFNQQIEGQFFVKEYKAVGEKNTFLITINNWRNQLISIIQENSTLNSNSKGLLVALLLGDRGGIDSALQNSFKELGVMHVLAISGLHIGIIYSFLVFVLAKLPLRSRIIIITLTLWLFVFLSGFSPSVFRAVLMFTAMTIAKGFKRNTSTLHIVSLSLFLSLLFKPMWLFDVGFQLSYTAVIGIVWIMPLFKSYISKKKWLRYIQSLIIVSFVAQLSVLPLQLYYFGQLPVFFLPANLIVIPCVTLLIISGIVWIICAPISGFISLLIGKGINTLSDGLFQIIKHINQWEWAKGFTWNIDKKQMLIIGLWVFVVALFFFYRKKRILLLSWSILLVLQLDYTFKQNTLVEQEWIVPYGFKNNVETLYREGRNLIVYTDSLDLSRTATTDYIKVSSITDFKVENERYYYKVGQKKVLHLNEQKHLYSFVEKDSISHLLFSGKVKVNFDRVMQEVNPQEVIIHNSVPNWIKNYIVLSCEKRKIPYYDIRSKGFYRLSF